MVQIIISTVTFLFPKMTKPLRLHLLLPTANKVLGSIDFSRIKKTSQKTKTKQTKNQLTFKVAMPKIHNRVLLKMSLRSVYEGMNMAHMFKCSLNNGHY